MIEVIGVRFKKAGKIYYFSPDGQQVEVGSNVIVETVRGTELGEVAIGSRLVVEEEITQPLKRVVRSATEEDLCQARDNRERETEAFTIAQKCIEALGLEMKLVGVECAFDKSKVVFFFTSEQRVDFRELVKDLAGRLHTRIELRQVGVRDEAKMLGGVGVCGRCLCCTTWIGDFSPVSIRHAKEQELSMNPGKISGLCGRLKCCLRYEAHAYQDARMRQPKLGDTISAPNGEARVVAVNLLRENASVQLPEGTRITVGWDQLERGCLTQPAVDAVKQACSQRNETPRVASNAEVSNERPRPESPSSTSPAKKGSAKGKGSGKRRRWRKRRPKRTQDAAGS